MVMRKEQQTHCKISIRVAVSAERPHFYYGISLTRNYASKKLFNFVDCITLQKKILAELPHCLPEGFLGRFTASMSAAVNANMFTVHGSAAA